MNAYIFDLDGTLFDSMNIWEKIDIAFLKKRGIELPDDYIESVFSLSFDEAAKYTIDRFGLPDSVDELLKEWNDMAIWAYGNTVKLKPYAFEYINFLKKRSKKLAIATSLPSELYIPALQNNRIMEVFDTICSTDEVGHGKSKPDVFLHTANRLNIEPERCILFEDMLEAIKSAKNIGMTVYGVYDESSKNDWNQIQKIADDVIYSFKDAPLLK